MGRFVLYYVDARDFLLRDALSDFLTTSRASQLNEHVWDGVTFGDPGRTYFDGEVYDEFKAAWPCERSGIDADGMLNLSYSKFTVLMVTARW